MVYANAGMLRKTKRRAMTTFKAALLATALPARRHGTTLSHPATPMLTEPMKTLSEHQAENRAMSLRTPLVTARHAKGRHASRGTIAAGSPLVPAYGTRRRTKLK